MFTLEETKFLLNVLDRVQIGGNRQAIQKAMGIADSIEKKLKRMLESQAPVGTQPATKPKRKRK